MTDTINHGGVNTVHTLGGEMTEDEKTTADHIEDYFGKQDHYLEGEAGVRALTDLTTVLGYKATGFMYGSAIETFLADNPGAQQALISWIEDQELPEWNTALIEAIEEQDNGYHTRWRDSD